MASYGPIQITEWKEIFPKIIPGYHQADWEEDTSSGSIRGMQKLRCEGLYLMYYCGTSTLLVQGSDEWTSKAINIIEGYGFKRRTSNKKKRRIEPPPRYDSPESHVLIIEPTWKKQIKEQFCKFIDGSNLEKCADKMHVKLLGMKFSENYRFE